MTHEKILKPDKETGNQNSKPITKQKNDEYDLAFAVIATYDGLGLFGPDLKLNVPKID